MSDDAPDVPADSPARDEPPPKAHGNADLDYTPTVLANLGVPIRLYPEPGDDDGPPGPDTPTVVERLRFTVNTLAILEEAVAGYRVERAGRKTVAHHKRNDPDRPDRATESTVEQIAEVETHVLYGDDAIDTMQTLAPTRLARILVAAALYEATDADTLAAVGARLPTRDIGVINASGIAAVQIATGVDPTVVSASLRGSVASVDHLRAAANEALVETIERQAEAIETAVAEIRGSSGSTS